MIFLAIVWATIWIGSQTASWCSAVIFKCPNQPRVESQTRRWVLQEDISNLGNPDQGKKRGHCKASKHISLLEQRYCIVLLVYLEFQRSLYFQIAVTNEPPHDKTNKMACAPSEDSDQPGHLPTLIRFFAVCMKKVWVLSYPLSAQQRLWSDWADAQADLSLRWEHSHFVGFVMRRLKCSS